MTAGWYNSDASSNYLGIYTFDSLADYEAVRPSHYSRRVGDPRIDFQTFQVAAYLQDDIRIRKNLTITPGLRYELQQHVGDKRNLGPRFGMTWAPFASGSTTLRGSVGTLYEWLPTGTYEQALRIDGFRQRELNMVNPSFPDPGSGAVILPVNRYLFGDDFHAPRTTRTSAGIDRQLFKVTRLAATYSYQRGSLLARGRNFNPLVNGIRPDTAFANIIEVVSDASSRVRQLQVDANVNPGALVPDPRGPRIKWKRATVFANYTLLSARNNTDGAFAIPATGNLDGEWGPASGGGDFGGFLSGPPQPQIAVDVRHRVNVTFNNQIIKNSLVQINVNAASASPYTLLTGADGNGDGIFNDRPAGVGRNSERASARTTVNMVLGYTFAFGRGASAPADRRCSAAAPQRRCEPLIRARRVIGCRSSCRSRTSPTTATISGIAA